VLFITAKTLLGNTNDLTKFSEKTRKVLKWMVFHNY